MDEYNDLEIIKPNSYGVHVNKGKDLIESIKKMIESTSKKIDSIQIFTHGPRPPGNRVSHNYKEIRKICKENDIVLYVHSSYNTNPWNNKENIYSLTINQFQSSAQLSSAGVVLHLPLMEPEKIAITVKKLVDDLLKEKLIGDIVKQKVILEMKAVKSHNTKSYETPDKINNLIENLYNKGLTSEHVCVCIDTAHIYASGADIYTYKSAKEYLDNIKYKEWIGLIHLNGNEYDAKIRAGDKHAIPLDKKDKVWSNISYTDSGCRAFIEFCIINKIHYILEIKDHHTYGDINNFLSMI